MRRVVILSAVALAFLGAFQLAQACLFIGSAQRVEGTVYAIETLSGPPKPRQKIPVHVTYEFKGKLERAEVRMPMLGSFAMGDRVPLWLSPTDPARPVLAEPSVLLATPLTLLVCGVIGAVLSALAARRKP